MADTKKGTESFSDKIKNWSKGLKAEFNKINWLTKDDITKQTVAVVSITVVLGLVIALVDFILQSGINFLVSL